MRLFCSNLLCMSVLVFFLSVVFAETNHSSFCEVISVLSPKSGIQSKGLQRNWPIEKKSFFYALKHESSAHGQVSMNIPAAESRRKAFSDRIIYLDDRIEQNVRTYLANVFREIHQLAAAHSPGRSRKTEMYKIHKTNSSPEMLNKDTHNGILYVNRLFFRLAEIRMGQSDASSDERVLALNDQFPAMLVQIYHSVVSPLTDSEFETVLEGINKYLLDQQRAVSSSRARRSA
ncbi:MAG: hypothetical protein JW774_08925 [Candidatus Aureabacteria bacterium]|nr:hypothetical protein [Candidatus Auribacterota bacterium]